MSDGEGLKNEHAHVCVCEGESVRVFVANIFLIFAA